MALFIDLQATVLKKHKSQLKEIFVEKTVSLELFSSSAQAEPLQDISQKVIKGQLGTEDLNFMLEALIQVSKHSEKLNQSSLSLLESLVKANRDAYTIELASQLV